MRFTDFVFREKESPGVYAGFCAVIRPSSGRTERTVKPPRISSERSVGTSDEIWRCSMPSGPRPDSSWEKSSDMLGRRVS